MGLVSHFGERRRTEVRHFPLFLRNHQISLRLHRFQHVLGSCDRRPSPSVIWAQSNFLPNVISFFFPPQSVTPTVPRHSSPLIHSSPSSSVVTVIGLWGVGSKARHKKLKSWKMSFDFLPRSAAEDKFDRGISRVAISPLVVGCVLKNGRLWNIFWFLRQR